MLTRWHPYPVHRVGMLGLYGIYLCQDGDSRSRDGSGYRLLEAGGYGAAVHDERCGREAENWNRVRCIGGCVGGHAARV